MEESASDCSYLFKSTKWRWKTNWKKPHSCEIGINTDGSVLDVKKLIKLAKKHDFDAVKFQKEIWMFYSRKSEKDNAPWGYKLFGL